MFEDEKCSEDKMIMARMLILKTDIHIIFVQRIMIKMAKMIAAEKIR